MNLNEYQDKAMSTCTDSCENINYMLLNLVGEVGEFSSKIAKAIRKEEVILYSNRLFSADGFDRMEALNQDLKLEAGDILWQLAGLCKVMGWTFEEVAQLNLDKLAARKANNTIIGEGDHR